MLLGETGAGKSTLANLFSGKKLQAIINDETGDMFVDAIQPDENMLIGHKMSSTTKIPNKIESDKMLSRSFTKDLVIWDCPGFYDTDPIVQEIVNSFYIKRLFEINKYLKFILVIPENKDKGTHFLESVSSFIKTFNDVELISNNISLVITKVEKHKKIQHVKKSIENILQDNTKATASHKLLVKKLIDSSLHVFHKPAHEGEMEYVDLLKEMNHVPYIESNPNMASINISSEALKCSSDLLKAAGSNFNKILEIILIAVTDATNCIDSNDKNNIFLKNHSVVIEDWIPGSMHHKYLPKHSNGEYFLKLDLLSKLYNILNVKTLDSIPSAITILQRAIETIAEYANEVPGTTQLREKIEDYGYCLQQQYEYVKFFASVCKTKLPTYNSLLELIKTCSTRVEDNLKYQVANLEIDKEQPADYYLKAIKYLSNYPKSEECIKLKAVCYTNLASIAEQQKDDIKATQYYLAAIEANKQIPEVYEKLGQLFTNKQEYSKAIDCYKVVNNEFGIKHCFKQWLKLEPKNPEIILKQANYFESIGIFDKAKLYYHHVFSLTQDESVKAQAWNKIGNILTNATDLGESFIERADAHHFCDYEIVDGSFIRSLVGETTDFSS